MIRSTTAITLLAALPFAIPQANAYTGQTCVGSIVQLDGGHIQLKPDKGATLWCDAEFPDDLAPKVLKACPVGSRCRIKGTFAGHGTFVWITITHVSAK